MIEILFRGKRVDNGEWVYGFYFQKQNPLSSDGLPITHCISDIPPFGYEVIPETVGQFTGLYDKNGKRIFDRDILSFETMRGTISFTVYYDEECGVWQPFGDSYCGFDPKDVEVIGNIHDNPELMEEKR